ncbi:MAG: hypothetical protein R6V39_00870, partial [Desulfovibrionales bacterium]
PNRHVFVRKIIEIKYISMVQICKIHRGKYKLKFKHTLTFSGRAARDGHASGCAAFSGRDQGG